ncbi:GntR family transcriptional regulator [Streptomyces sp. NPDC056161]|uniref:GntR family transcriptional regulator n=1 Tax=Streptomyces sp. NPDC056161 TaxID=3345732 RepID=UPI0035D5317A
MKEFREVTGAILPDYSEPLWVQAVNLIHGEIEKGVLKPGARLAPERELCGQLGISRVTLRKALTHLVERGELSASHGRGWYVARTARKKEWPSNLESFSETAARMGLRPHSTVLRARTTPASFDEAERLGVAPGTALFCLERVRLLDDVPIALDLNRIPLALVPEVENADFTTGSFYATLARAGVEPVRADTTIEATKADEHAAEHLGLAPGDPLLVLHQLALGSGQEPLFLSTIRYAGDRYRLRTSFARSFG